MIALLLACRAPVAPVAVPEPPAPVVAPEPVAPPFTERALPFDAEREALSVAYLAEHYGLVQDDATITPHVVVLHWTAGPTADGAFETFAPTHLSGRPELGGGVNVSAHFLVDRDGTAWRLLPETTMARHVIGLNHVAVGIENVGGGEDWPLTDAQRDTNVALVRWLAERYAITHVIGHHEYRSMEGHPYWAERDDGYRTEKIDPGPAFAQAVRARVSDLGLSGPPGTP